MATYLLAYHGGGDMPTTAAGRAEMMTAWNDWYDDLGDAVIDVGNPVLRARSIASDGTVSDGGGANPVSGYTVIEADDLDEAVELAKGCPVLASGGTVEVAETFEPV